MRRARREGVDLLLSLDYRPNYQFLYWSMPRTPLIIWARDPWPPADVAQIASLRLPHDPVLQPQGTTAFDCTSLRWVLRAAPWLQRQVVIAVPAPHLAAKVAPTYGVRVSHCPWLPNIIDLPPAVSKSPHPRVVFLGRLDPTKRPWLYVELARQFPEVEFLMLGQSYMHGAGSWQPTALPPNVRWLGHVDGTEKLALLTSSWVLINTSIHEGLPVSCLEALACETPLLSCLDPEGLVSQFGRYVGRWDGTGLEAIPAFTEQLRCLLDTPSLVRRLGQEGRQWVAETHNRARFLAAFETLCAQVGLPR
jgi:glycosyltransferase involved in cell wall biosynthesis